MGILYKNCFFDGMVYWVMLIGLFILFVFLYEFLLVDVVEMNLVVVVCMSREGFRMLYIDYV